MPASWRPSRGPGYELDEILALAGSDRMTIPAPLLEKLSNSEEVVPQCLDVESAKDCDEELVGNGMITEAQFRYELLMDQAGEAKLAEGLRAFITETDKLEAVILAKVKDALN
jgi:transaldolase